MTALSTSCYPEIDLQKLISRATPWEDKTGLVYDLNQRYCDYLKHDPAIEDLFPEEAVARLLNKKQENPLVVNFFGGPGTGKSTNRALVFGKLKIRGIEAEETDEYAKGLTYEKREAALAFQPYVSIKQAWRIARLRQQMDVLVTDSPFILGLAYPTFGSLPSFETFIVDLFNLFNNYNIYLRRNTDLVYQTNGRNQDLLAAKEKDRIIRAKMDLHKIPYEIIDVGNSEDTANYIVEKIIQKLKKPA